MAYTNSGSKLYVCATPQNSDLTQNEFEGLDWVEVKGVGSHGETGTTQNIVGYDTWDLLFQQKAKGIANAGDPEVELAKISGDPGQNILRTAGAASNANSYATKIVRNDAVPGGVGTTLYNRGKVVGPRSPNGRNEDFVLRIFQFGFEQEQIEVDASPISITGTAPAGADGVAYTFTPTVDGDTGAVSFNWYGDDLALADLEFNTSTGAITGTAAGPNTLVGTITVTDSVNARGVLRVAITISA